MDRSRRSPYRLNSDLDPVCEGREMQRVGLQELEDLESWMRYVMEVHNNNRQGNVLQFLTHLCPCLGGLLSIAFCL